MISLVYSLHFSIHSIVTKTKYMLSSCKYILYILIQKAHQAFNEGAY